MNKISFDEFKEKVINDIKAWLPAGFNNVHVSLRIVNKNNGLTLTGLVIKNPDTNIAPAIYLEQYYEQYKAGNEMDDILRQIADCWLSYEVPESLDISKLNSFENCRDIIFPRLVSAEMNRDTLEGQPHRLIGDLAVIYTINLGEAADSRMTITVHNGLFEMWKIGLDELHLQAISNLENAGTGRFTNMLDVMKEMLGDCEDSEIAIQMIDNLEDDDPINMYVLSNKSKLFGASVLLDKYMMRNVIDRVGEDFYILPSSIHEVIIVPAEDSFKSEHLASMIYEINRTQVAMDERLSDSVYRYSERTGLYRAA